MKYLLFFFFISISSLGFSQKKTEAAAHCEIERMLIEKATSNQMKNEIGESIPTDNLETWKAATTMPGSTRCIIQDAVSAKAYVAEFGFVFNKADDAALAAQLNMLVAEFKACFKNDFRAHEVGGNPVLIRGTVFEGIGKYAETKVDFFQLYNPAEKKQFVSITIMYDP